MADAIDGILMEDGSKQLLESTSWSDNPQTHDEFTATIIYYWNQSVNGILKIGTHLRAAKGLLDKKFPDLQKSLENRGLPTATQKKCMEISANEKVMGHFRGAIREGSSMVLPNEINTLYAISKLEPDQFDSGVNRGLINPDTTRKDLIELNPPKKKKGKDPVKLDGTLGARINVKVDGLKNAQHAKDLESAINTAIQGVVTQFKGVCFHEIKPISELWDTYKKKEQEKADREMKSAEKKIDKVTESLVGLSDEEIATLSPELQEFATRMKTTKEGLKAA